MDAFSPHAPEGELLSLEAPVTRVSRRAESCPPRGGARVRAGTNIEGAGSRPPGQSLPTGGLRELALGELGFFPLRFAKFGE